MKKSVYRIPGMDCGAEEQLARAVLADMPGIVRLDFNLTDRSLTVIHEGKPEPITAALYALDLGAKHEETAPAGKIKLPTVPDQSRVLWAVLVINFLFFLVEMTSGLISRSMGLVADSLDMLADAFVYAISLLAVGRSVARKKRVARTAGFFQILLAGLGFAEVVRRFLVVEEVPDFTAMIIVSLLALGANTTCLVLLRGARGREEAHMRASLIFTSNDVIINLGVIAAGVSVKLLNSNKPDLVIGTIVFLLVMHGARRILKLGR